MEKKSLSIDSLLVDEANPRFATIQESELDSIIQMMNSQKNKLIELMKSVLTIGLSPIENLAVYKSIRANNKYIVAEGNRRISALKILQNPDYANHGPYSKNKISEIRKLSIQYKQKPITSIDCAIFEDYDHAAPWIELRHRGEQGGAGLVKWGAEENVRFDERVGGKKITTIIKDYFIENNIISKKESNNIALTNLRRFVNDKKIQEFLQFKIENNSLNVDKSNVIFITIIGNYLKLLATGNPKVTEIYHQSDRFKYMYGKLLVHIQDKCNETDLKIINEYFLDNLNRINQQLSIDIKFPISIVDNDEQSNKKHETNETHESENPDKQNDDKQQETSSADSSNNDENKEKTDNRSNNESDTTTEDTHKDSTNTNGSDTSTDKSRHVAKTFQELFTNLIPDIKTSKIDKKLIKIIINDINEASIAFNNGAFKACIIMIGAAIEGIMLGTLLRKDVFDHVRANPTGFDCIKNYGLSNPNEIELRNKIIEKISYESLKHFSFAILPELKDTKLQEIQNLRNVIHPSISLKNSIERMDQPKAIMLISSVYEFIDKILQWIPPK